MNNIILIRPITSKYIDPKWLGNEFRFNFTDIIGRKTSITDRYEFWYMPSPKFFIDMNKEENRDNKDNFEYGIYKNGFIYIQTYDQIKLNGDETKSFQKSIKCDQIQPYKYPDLGYKRDYPFSEYYSENEYSRDVILGSIKKKLKE